MTVSEMIGAFPSKSGDDSRVIWPVVLVLVVVAQRRGCEPTQRVEWRGLVAGNWRGLMAAKWRIRWRWRRAVTGPE